MGFWTLITTNINWAISRVGIVMLFVNATVNPIIYSLSNPRYRMAYLKVFYPKGIKDNEMMVKRNQMLSGNRPR